MGLLRPHPSPYTTLAEGYYPTFTVLATTGDFQGIMQGVDSKAYARPELCALGKFLERGWQSPAMEGFLVIHSKERQYLCCSSLLHQQWKHLSSFFPENRCWKLLSRCQHCWLCQCFWQGTQLCTWKRLSYGFVAPELHFLSATGKWCWLWMLEEASTTTEWMHLLHLCHPLRKGNIFLSYQSEKK